MATASIRDLRTSFPRVRALLARDGEIVVTDRGRAAYVLRTYSPPPADRPKNIDYFERLKAHQPHAISPARSRALDEADRGER
ncbi:MAG: type II toxin-antitoxin system Phd/YefM family antitoxin [Polyangiaceae bacterium]|nr:type II toxin-antitoxin system Phd/YefM family antitoxin [Polyangiaceae bacterium]